MHELSNFSIADFSYALQDAVVSKDTGDVVIYDSDTVGKVLVGYSEFSEIVEGTDIYIANEKDITEAGSFADRLIRTCISSFVSGVYGIDSDSFWTNDSVEKTTLEDSVDGVPIICHCFSGENSDGNTVFITCFFVDNTLYYVLGDNVVLGARGTWNSLEDKHFSDYLIDSISAGSDLEMDSSMSSTGQSSSAGSSSSLSSFLVKGEGMYKVGSDVPSGDYIIFDDAYPSTGYSTYTLSNSSDAASDDIADIQVIQRFAYTHINDGQYVELHNCSLYSLDASEFIDISGEGMFRVGSDIQAGELQLIADEDYSTYTVYSSIDPNSNDIVDIGVISGNAYVTVSDGQVLDLANCHIAQ